MKDMIEVEGVLQPSTYKKARAIETAQLRPIEKARKKMEDARQELIRTCLKQYPVGSAVLASRDLASFSEHEVYTASEYGWLGLRNLSTGDKWFIEASSYSILPDVRVYKRVKKQCP